MTGRLKEWHKIVFLMALSFWAAALFYQFLLRGLAEKSAALEHDAFLELSIAGIVPERAAKDPFKDILGEGAFTSLQEVLQTVRKAQRDVRIKGIILKPAGLLMGWAKTDELRNALQEFRTSGKPVYAYLEATGDREYYLATVADTLLAPPTGMLLANGFASQPFFFKQALEKIGVQADFVAHKEYKTAPHQYTRDRLSPEAREVINAILDQYFQALVDTLARTRKMDPAAVRQLIDRGLFSMQSAFQKGLLDTLMYYQPLKDHLKRQYGEKLVFVGPGRYRSVPFPKARVNEDKAIAVIFGVGTIVNGGEGLYRQGDLITSNGMAAAIRTAAEDDAIKAIVLRIDSPGGSGSASDIIWGEVQAAREKKPVFASVSDVAASGGYYIAMAADTIVAHPHSLVGSIGIFAGKFSLQKLYGNTGVTYELLKRGQNADFFSETRPFTAEQRQILSEFLLEFYRDFVDKAAAARGMSPEEMEKIARGRVWTGAQGERLGLVDVLGDFHTAIAIAKERLGIPRDELVRLVIYPRLESYWERLWSTGLPLRMAENLPPLKNISPRFRGIIRALPYFQTGEPLYLDLLDF